MAGMTVVQMGYHLVDWLVELKVPKMVDLSAVLKVLQTVTQMVDLKVHQMAEQLDLW